MASDAPPDLLIEMVQGCHMARARLVTRHLAHIYDEAMRPFGLQASQFHLLVAVAFMGQVRRTTLAAQLRLQPSTLTRNLRVMAVNGWIEEAPETADARARPVRATRAGHALLARVAPAWREAQQRAKTFLGTDADAALRSLAAALQTKTAPNA